MGPIRHFPSLLGTFSDTRPLSKRAHLLKEFGAQGSGVQTRGPPYLRQLGDLLAHLQVQVLGVLHGDGRRGRGEFPLTGGAVVLLPTRPGRHLHDDASDARRDGL